MMRGKLQWCGLSLGVLFILAVIAMLGLSVGAVFGEDKPLTHEAALQLIAGWGIDKTADKIVVLDWLMREDPVVTMPVGVYALKGADLAVGWDPPYVRVVFPNAFPDHPVPIDFRIPLVEVQRPGFVPGRSAWPVILGVAAAAAGGVIADEVLPLPPFAKQATAVGLGACLGLLVWWLVP